MISGCSAQVAISFRHQSSNLTLVPRQDDPHRSRKRNAHRADASVRQWYDLLDFGCHTGFRHHSNPQANSNQPTLDLTDVKCIDEGEYSVSASLGSASAITNPATLSVLPSTSGEVSHFRSMKNSAERQVTFEIAGAFGTKIGVYASSGLLHWSPLSTHPNTDGTII